MVDQSKPFRSIQLSPPGKPDAWVVRYHALKVDVLFGVLFGDGFCASTLTAETDAAGPVLVMLENALPATAPATYFPCSGCLNVDQVLVSDRIKLD